jgi:hypothetical protein
MVTMPLERFSRMMVPFEPSSFNFHLPIHTTPSILELIVQYLSHGLPPAVLAVILGLSMPFLGKSLLPMIENY